MAGYVSTNRILDYLGNFAPNDVGDTNISNTNIEYLITDVADEIEQNWKLNYGEIPIPTRQGSIEEDFTWIDLILEFVSTYKIVGEIYYRKSISQFQLSKKKADIYKGFAHYIWQTFNAGELLAAILATIDPLLENPLQLDTRAFLDGDDLRFASLTNMSEITEYTNPKKLHIDRFALLGSAFIRGLAYSQGFVSNLDDLEEKELAISTYQSLLIKLVAPQVALINLSYSNIGTIDQLVGASILDTNTEGFSSAKTALQELAEGQKYYNRIPRI